MKKPGIRQLMRFPVLLFLLKENADGDDQDVGHRDGG
jgi:hypothetical protein